MEIANQAHANNDLAKAAKAVGAKMETSDLVGQTGQVPDLGQWGKLLRSSSRWRRATSAGRS